MPLPVALPTERALRKGDLTCFRSQTLGRHFCSSKTVAGNVPTAKRPGDENEMRWDDCRRSSGVCVRRQGAVMRAACPPQHAWAVDGTKAEKGLRCRYIFLFCFAAFHARLFELTGSQPEPIRCIRHHWAVAVQGACRDGSSLACCDPLLQIEPVTATCSPSQRPHLPRQTSPRGHMTR